MRLVLCTHPLSPLREDSAITSRSDRGLSLTILPDLAKTPAGPPPQRARPTPAGGRGPPVSARGPNQNIATPGAGQMDRGGRDEAVPPAVRNIAPPIESSRARCVRLRVCAVAGCVFRPPGPSLLGNLIVSRLSRQSLPSSGLVCSHWRCVCAHGSDHVL